MDDENRSTIQPARTATRRKRCASSRSTVLNEREQMLPGPEAVYCDHLIELFCIKLSDGQDHPAIWATWPDFMEGFPAISERLANRLARTKPDETDYVALCIGQAMCCFHGEDGSADGDRSAATAILHALKPVAESAALVRGALDYLQGCPPG